ncbi:acyl-CoA oxidase [Meredithblackwellia eburnea MCA 4105]
MTSQSTIDLNNARGTASFDSTTLGRVLRGKREAEVRRRVSKVLEADPAFDKSKKAYLSRAQRLEQGMRMTRRLLELKAEKDWSYEEYVEAMSTTDDSLPINLHEIAFQPVLASQASDEQQAKWLPRSMEHAILGCYLQTELGHGSNVQQLETTATYDEKTEEFVINSPTVTSTKWWIGALGIMATHGVVQARLFIKGQEYGPHLFLVQLRSLEDHSPMPSIELGEIGPKVHGGYTPVDNGWARFSNVRIPRDQMLARFARVAKDGTYTKPPHSKLSYGGMIFIRAQMIGGLGWSLAKAATISTRYLHIRRQFADPDLKPGDKNFGVENQVITYPSVYMRILPQIAKAFVFIAAGKDIQRLYWSMSEQLKGGNTTLLAETHAVSSGLKSYITTSVVEGVEVLRRAMGGHGFLDAAGIGRIYAMALPSATYEGDNFILNLQVARAALKTLGAYRQDSSIKLSPSTAYLSALGSSTDREITISGADAWLSRPLQIQIVSLRAALQVERLDRLIQSGKAFSQLSWECVNVCKAVVEAFLVRRMIEAVAGGVLVKGVGEPEKKVMDTVIHFYVLSTIEAALPDLLEFGVIKPVPASASTDVTLAGPIESLRAQINTLAQKILPEAIGLTDAFGFSDWDLGSELGKYDGRAYENLLEKAKRDLDDNVGDAAKRKQLYENEIRPILQQGKRNTSKL